MYNVKTKFWVSMRFLCILSVTALGLVSIIGSGDDSGSSSTEYDTVPLTIDYDQIDVQYDADNPTPTTVGCTDVTTMLDELLDIVSIPDPENLRVIDSTITSLQINYRALWTDVQSLQEIACESSIQGDWDGSIDQEYKLVFGNWTGWRDANAVDNSTRTAFTNYFSNYRKEYQICVSCSSLNLFNSYALNYLVSMDVELVIARDNIDTTTEAE